MRKWLRLLFLVFVPIALMAQTFSVGQYAITGGTVNRSDANRWVDNWVEAPEIGVDCTNTNDSTTAIQNWANANLNGGHLRFPNNCVFFTTATIVVTNAVNLTFDGPSLVGQGATPTTQWNWKGTNGGTACSAAFASCQYVIDFEHSDHPAIERIEFNSLNGSTGWIGDHCPDGFLKFDGNPSGHIGTGGRVLSSMFGNGSCNNPNFVAVDISHTAANNHENYIVKDDTTFCSDTTGSVVASNIVTTSGSATITSASAPFTAGMVGKRIRLSYANNTNPGGVGAVAPLSRGWFDTTIASFTNTSTVVLAAAVPWTANPVHGWLGGGLGIAYRNGASQNAIQQTFANVLYFGCEVGVYVAGGGVEVTQLSSGFSDIGMFKGGFTAQNTTLDYYAAENDFIAVIDGGGIAPFELSNSRLSNANQGGWGFIWLGGNDTLRNNLVNFGLPNTNSVLAGPLPGIGVSALGTITGGSGYVNGTYNNVPLVLASGGSLGIANVPGSITANITVAGGAVTAVTIVNQGSTPIPNAPGASLTASNSNLGGSGSGFSVVMLATFAPTTAPTSTGQDNFGALTNINNAWEQGCCGVNITWTNSGFSIFNFNSLGAQPPIFIGANGLGGSIPASMMIGQTQLLSLAPHAAQGPTVISLDVVSNELFADTGNIIGIRAEGAAQPNGSNTWIGVQALPTSGRMNGPTSIMFDAAWNGISGIDASAGLTNGYGFRAETPTTVGGTLTSLYGFDCEQQKVTNVTNGFCFYNRNAADFNFFAGPVITAPTTVGALPACSGSTQGATMFVTDQNNFINYHGAISGGGTNKQRVTCDGTAWYQD